MAKQQKYYVVWEGHKPGVYTTWEDCQLQTIGYKGAKYKSFDKREAAEAAFKQSPWKHINQGGAPAPKAGKSGASKSKSAIVWHSLSVDAACAGNPGVMEYQGVDTKTSERLFHRKFDLGTNNIGEFLALVHALALLKKQGLNTLIYTDSATAMAWVRNKKAKTTLTRNHKTEALYEMIDRAEKWLKENTYTNPIVKWETEHWGEIPADFGRK